VRSYIFITSHLLLCAYQSACAIVAYYYDLLVIIICLMTTYHGVRLLISTLILLFLPPPLVTADVDHFHTFCVILWPWFNAHQASTQRTEVMNFILFLLVLTLCKIRGKSAMVVVSELRSGVRPISRNIREIGSEYHFSCVGAVVMRCGCMWQAIVP
jgi:hypothetical protein